MKVIAIGKKLVPVEQVAFVEPFDPSVSPEFKPEKDYKGGIVMLNGDIVLTEQTPQEFAAEHELHLFTEDSVAVNRAIVFRVETFEPTESFKPAKPYKTRLKWRGLTGGEQSKLCSPRPRPLSRKSLASRKDWPRRRSVRRGDRDVAATGRVAWRRFAASLPIVERSSVRTPAAANPGRGFSH